jgi:hypothetical protein
MSFDIQPYDWSGALLHWAAVMGVCAVVALFVGSVVAFLTMGTRGPRLVVDTFRRGLTDLTRLSPRRIGALAVLALKESYNRRALYVLFVFVALFAAANLFLRTPSADLPAKPYVSFVLTVITWMLLPVALLLSCWGLPAEIKDRSLHTIVTKPVRRSEIVIGRMAGYGLLTTLVLVAVAIVGYVWIKRVVPETSQRQLTSRRPIYSTAFYYYNREGERSDEKLNTGDIWQFRGFIEGQTKARAVWEFTGLDVAELSQRDHLDLEYRMEAFRTHKGNIDEGVRFRLTLVNDNKKLRVPYPQTSAGLEVQEFAAERKSRLDAEADRARLPVVSIPRELVLTAGSGDEEGGTVDLFDDLIENGQLTIEVSCEDAQQFVGAAHPDLFIRLPDRPFAAGYFKSMLCTWLMVLLVIMIGTTASCFLKGPVATLLTFGLVILGKPLRAFMEELLGQFMQEGQVLGGGTLESIYRMVTHMNQQSELPDNLGTTVIKFCDEWIFNGLGVIRNVIPDFTHFDGSVYVANGFDVPWSDAGAAVLPSILTTLGFFIPCVILGYFSLQLRELESK